jgi:hypothetical protein
MCEATTEKSILEERFWRSQLACSTFDDMCKMGLDSYSDKDALDRSTKETVIKLFAVSLITMMCMNMTLLWFHQFIQEHRNGHLQLLL